MKLIRKLILPILFLSTLFACVPNNTNQMAEYIDYIGANSTYIEDLNKKDESYYNFDDCSIILLGEKHGIAKTYDAEIELIKFLNEKYDVQKVFLEAGYCDISIVNEYLKTGEEKLIEDLVSYYKGTFGGNESLINFYKDIYSYNKDISDENKITLFAGDIQHQPAIGLYAMSRLFPHIDAPESIKNIIDKIYNYKNLDTFNEETINMISESFSKYSSDYTEYLGEKTFNELNNMLKYIFEGLEYYKNDDDYYRERKMIEYFLSEYSKSTNEKYLGIYGGMHSTLNSYYSDESKPALGNYLQNVNEDTKNKIASISLMYFNSKYMNIDGKEKHYNDDIPILRDKLNSMTHDIYFCPLDLVNSPFANENDRSLQSQQYIIMIKDSPGTKQIQ